MFWKKYEKYHQILRKLIFQNTSEFHENSEVVAWTCSIKQVLLKNLQNSQRNTWLESPFRKVTGPRLATFLKMRVLHKCFPMNFAKFFGTLFFNITPPVAASDFYEVNFSKKEGQGLSIKSFFSQKFSNVIPKKAIL